MPIAFTRYPCVVRFCNEDEASDVCSPGEGGADMGGFCVIGLWKKLVREFRRQKDNQNVRESYMALTNMVKNAEIVARAEGCEERDNSIASTMLKAKEPMAKIIEYTQLPLEKIQELAISIGVDVVV